MPRQVSEDGSIALQRAYITCIAMNSSFTWRQPGFPPVALSETQTSAPILYTVYIISYVLHWGLVSWLVGRASDPDYPYSLHLAS
jgi:hypothetical protein